MEPGVHVARAPGSGKPRGMQACTCDAVRIRCRRCRTQSSSGPFTITVVPQRRPTCPSVPVCSVIVCSQAHLTRVSALSGPGTSPCPASCAGRPAEAGRGAPVSCCLSAAGVRFPGHPTPAGGLGLPCGRLTSHVTVAGPHRGSHVPHVRGTTGLGASYTPGTAVLPRPVRNPWPAPAASQRPVPAPRLQRPTWRGSRSRDIKRRFTFFTRPVCPLPVTPGWSGGPSASPRASHPAGRTGDARRGWGQAFEHEA